MGAFISYSRNDYDAARRFSEKISAVVPVWMDKEIAAGDNFGEEIPFRILSADVVIVLWSRSSISSTWVRAEASQAIRQGKLISYNIDDTLPPEPMNTIHCQSAPNGVLHDVDLARLVERIGQARRGASINKRPFEAAYAEFLAAKAHMHALCTHAQAARLRALDIEREGFDVKTKATEARAMAERGAAGYRVAGRVGSKYFGKVKEGFIKDTRFGFGVVCLDDCDVYSEFNSSGDSCGVQVIVYHRGRRFQRRVSQRVESYTEYSSSATGVHELFGSSRFEGELFEQAPTGFGVEWYEGGGFAVGRFENWEAAGEISWGPVGPCIAVSAAGDVKMREGVSGKRA